MIDRTLFEDILLNNEDALIITDSTKTILWINKEYAEMSGYEKGQIFNLCPMVSLDPYDDQKCMDLFDHVDEKGRWEGEVFNRFNCGEHCPCKMIMYKRGDLYINIVKDIRARTYNSCMANKKTDTDPLTLLLNRETFTEKLNKALFYPNPLCLIIFHIDDFKIINDVKGYKFGDLVLVDFANSLRKFFVSDIYRIGGGEFAIILENEIEEGCSQRISEFIDLFKTEVTEIRMEVNYSLSIGISSTAFDRSYSKVMRNTDIALSIAKADKEKPFAIYDKEAAMEIENEMRIQKLFKSGIDPEEFYVCYQPITNSNTDKIMYYEVLMRWHNKEYGNIPPDIFIKIAEKSSHMEELGEILLKNTFLNMEQLYAKVDQPVLSINVSVLQLMNPRFVNQLLEYMSKYNVPAKSIIVEVTESQFINNLTAIDDNLDILRNHGILIAIDDFGTGYSSLNKIPELKADKIKIDKSFIDQIDNLKYEYLISFISNLATSLELEVIAEGVENKTQLDILKKNNINLIQGYYYSKPKRIEEL